MSRDKAAIDYSIKFGFGSSYKKKVITRTVSMIVSSKKCNDTPDSMECDSLKLLREQTMQPENRREQNLSKISENDKSVLDSNDGINKGTISLLQ